MPSKYKIQDHQIPHFITFATVQWVDALSRPQYKDIIIASLKYCVENKGLILYAYVIMNNHVHFIAAARPKHNLSDILRDFKKFTSKKLIDTIINSRRESRRTWMKWIFEFAGAKNSNNSQFQFWQQDNHPIELSTSVIEDQRLNYLHNNPVKEGIVDLPEYYIYSSARNYVGQKGLLEVEILT